MKKFVSVNAKYYKNSHASGELGHVNRLFKTNANAFSEYTKYNFGSAPNLLSEYQKIHEKRNRVGKKAQKNANTYVDAVMSFSLNHWEHLEKKHGNAKLQRAMKIMMKNYMNDMKETYGLEPVGYEYHLDEGHNKNELKRNIHAHVIFYNYDFNNKISPLRKFKKNDFSLWQTMAEKHMSKAGFVRGISKERTQKKHVEKNNFVEQKLKQKEGEFKAIQKDIVVKNTELEKSKSAQKRLKVQMIEFLNEFKLGITKFVKHLLTCNINAIERDINYLNTVVDRTYEVDQDISNHMINVINNTSETFDYGKAIKPKQ